MQVINCWLNRKFVNTETDAFVRRRFDVGFLSDGPDSLDDLKLATIIYWGDRVQLTEQIDK